MGIDLIELVNSSNSKYNTVFLQRYLQQKSIEKYGTYGLYF